MPVVMNFPCPPLPLSPHISNLIPDLMKHPQRLPPHNPDLMKHLGMLQVRNAFYKLY